MDFHPVEFNLRESFRVLAEGRPAGDVLELPGVSIASVGARFQMFNAAYLSAPVSTPADLDDRLRHATGHFRSRGFRWSFWVCEDWLAAPVRRILSRACDRAGLRLAAEMPGMAADRLRFAKRRLPALECYRVDSDRRLADFHAIGAVCFNVPMLWFSEVFDSALFTARPRFTCWVGYRDGFPVATAATVRTGRVLGLYNIATEPDHRNQGYAEAITRHVVEAESGADALVLQSTSQGFRLYDRLGFRSVTRILVYNSIP
jgi:GNAT superfamily N-acetyltransferase